jgi:hypothetical protein
MTDLVGKSARNSTEFCDYSDSVPFELRNFHQNFFPIVKCVPTILEHVPSILESSPTISSSNFMTRKIFPTSVLIWPAKLKSARIPQLVHPTLLNHMDVGTIPGKAILMPV